MVLQGLVMFLIDGRALLELLYSTTSATSQQVSENELL